MTDDFDFTPWDSTVAPKLAVAWRGVVRELSDGQWHRGDLLAKKVQPETEVLVTTVRGLLNEMRKRGWVDKRFAAQKRRYFRLSEKGRAEMPVLQSVLLEREAEIGAVK